jgi:hypothetical protein
LWSAAGRWFFLFGGTSSGKEEVQLTEVEESKATLHASLLVVLAK